MPCRVPWHMQTGGKGGRFLFPSYKNKPVVVDPVKVQLTERRTASALQDYLLLLLMDRMKKSVAKRWAHVWNIIINQYWIIFPPKQLQCILMSYVHAGINGIHTQISDTQKLAVQIWSQFCPKHFNSIFVPLLMELFSFILGRKGLNSQRAHALMWLYSETYLIFLMLLHLFNHI